MYVIFRQQLSAEAARIGAIHMITCSHEISHFGILTYFNFIYAVQLLVPVLVPILLSAGKPKTTSLIICACKNCFCTGCS